jgi:DedD protein
MARPISDEELQLKKRARRRLVGAIVLVTAVAVILPMVLDSEPKPVGQNVDIQIPSPDSGEFKPKAAPGAGSAVDGSPIKGMPAVKSESSAAASKSESAASRSVATADTAVAARDAGKRDHADSSDTATDGAKAAKREEAKADDGASANGAFVVQVAALADNARVKQLQKQMTGAGVKTYTEVVTTKAGEVTRVRAGPYPTREAAESARTQLKKAGLDGKIVPK